MDSLSTAAFFAWDEANRAASAAELRGELLQMLTAAAMDAGSLRGHPDGNPGTGTGRDDMLALLRGAVASTQRIATGLRPLLLDGTGIASALQFLAGEHARRTGRSCELEMDESLDVSAPLAIGLFRIAQDWLRGFEADGGPVHIAVAPSAHDLILRMRDDGVAQGPGGSLKARSLAIVAERVHLLGGSMSMGSKAGAGTQLDVRLPAGRPMAG